MIYTLESRKKLPGITREDVAGLEPLTTAISTDDDNRERNMWAFTAAAFDLFAEALR